MWSSRSRSRKSWRSPKAAAWLAKFVAADADALDVALADCMRRRAATAADTLVLGQRGGEELAMHWIGSSGLGETMLLLQVRPAAATRSRTTELTRREAEVLSWLAKGKTNRDIAEILGMSPRTVNKHLEHIYAKLGVETRTSAAAVLVHETGPARPAGTAR